METMKIIRDFPAGIVTPPGSKSLAHRAAILSWLASRSGVGESVVRGIDLSEDIAATLNAIAALGANWTLTGSTLTVRGAGDASGKEVDCGESGSTLRFLLPLAALDDRETVFTGKGRLMERPMDDFLGCLTGAGAQISRRGGAIAVQGPIRSGIFRLPGNVSSQFVSGLLLAAPMLEGDSEIALTTPLESSAYVDMTVAAMKRHGVAVDETQSGYRVRGGQTYHPADYRVEADYSQAAYFLAAAALGRDVWCRGLRPDSIQGDRAILDVLGRMGAAITFKGELTGVSARKLWAVTVDAREIPDLIPPIAALCCFCAGTSRIEGAGRLRYKESDRLAALATELTKLGARVKEGSDCLEIEGQRSLPGGRVDAHNDHRIAMAMALVAIRCDGPVELTGAQSVAKSYPAFWEDFSGQAPEKRGENL